MSKLASTWMARWRNSCVLPCALFLAIVVFSCGVALLPIALWTEGVRGAIVLGSAGLICLASGCSSLVVTGLQVPGKNPLKELLLAMAFRLTPPLSICLLLSVRGSGFEYLGFVCYLLVFYMVTLAAETCLSVRRIQPQVR